MPSGRIWRWLIAVFLLITIVESSAALMCWLLSLSSQASRFLWNPDLEQARINWNAHSSWTDDEIGGFRAPGAKPNPEFPAIGQLCGSAYGDSFVFGFEVPDKEGWIEQLSHLLNCRV